jgi:dolichyl-phosphate beta-glucosyltransferase
MLPEPNPKRNENAIRELHVTLVIPCFNEEARLNEDYFRALIASGSIRLHFVNDGSTDGTLRWIEKFAAGSSGVEFSSLDSNSGKSEAVRLGMINCTNSSTYVGFLDADGAFQYSDVIRLSRMMLNQSISDNSSHRIDALLSSRVKLSGRDIARSQTRHVIGRLITTFIGFYWKKCPYDSQSGFKIFHASDNLKNALSEPFKTRWFVDVELLVRLQMSDKLFNIWEEPVNSWKDVKGSNIKFKSFFSIFREIVYVARLSKKNSIVLP